METFTILLFLAYFFKFKLNFLQTTCLSFLSIMIIIAIIEDLYPIGLLTWLGLNLSFCYFVLFVSFFLSVFAFFWINSIVFIVLFYLLYWCISYTFLFCFPHFFFFLLVIALVLIVYIFIVSWAPSNNIFLLFMYYKTFIVVHFHFLPTGLLAVVFIHFISTWVINSKYCYCFCFKQSFIFKSFKQKKNISFVFICACVFAPLPFIHFFRSGFHLVLFSLCLKDLF